MPTIPRVFAESHVPIAPQRLGNPIFDQLVDEAARYAAKAERQQLQSYDTDIQTQIREGVMTARRETAAISDPDQFQQTYNTRLDELRKKLEPTTQGNRERELIFQSRYGEQLRSEMDNVVSGTVVRRRGQSLIDAEKNQSLAIDRFLNTSDVNEKRDIEKQYNNEVQAMPFLTAQEKQKFQEGFIVETVAAAAAQRAENGDALGALKDLETGAYGQLDSAARRRVRGELNSVMNQINSIADRQQKTDKQVLESMIEAAILDNKPAEEIKALIRRGVDQRLFGRTDMQAYENRVIGKAGKDTPEQIANFNEFRARFQNQTYTAKGLQQAQEEARKMYKAGELGDIGYGSIGGLFRQVENHLDIKAHRGAAGAGQAGTIRGYDQGATIIRRLYPNLSGDMLNRRVAPYMKEYNDAVVSGGRPAVETARDIYTRASKQIEAQRRTAKEAADAAAKAAQEKAKGGVAPDTLNAIKGLTQ